MAPARRSRAADTPRPAAIVERPPEASTSGTAPSARPQLYLSCATECFSDFLKQELDYFDFARDPYDATYVIVISQQPNGQGGVTFTVRLTERGATAEPVSKREETLSLPAGTAPHDARAGVLQAIYRLLYERLAQTIHARAFELSLEGRDGAGLAGVPDPWDYWVLAPELGGSGEGGSGYHFIELKGALTIRRITERSKVRLRGSFGQNLNSYVLETGERVSATVGYWDTRLLLGRSWHRHFAAGAVIVGRGSEFENLRGHFHGGPLLEANLFPSRQLRLAYQAGPWANWYYEPNVADLERELRPYHALSLVTDLNQRWGSAQWLVQWNQFLDDPSLFRLSTGGNLAIRLTRGLAFVVGGEAAWVRDLVNLRGREVTDLELLLWTTQQPTDFEIEGSLSLSYTFGSQHDTVVNPRLERVDVSEE
jgi:hypothetical protein